jgi:K+-sensing histidine kinase KdpD
LLILDRVPAAAREWASRLGLPLLALDDADLRNVAAPDDLVVLSQDLPWIKKRQLLRQTQGAVLACAAELPAVPRVLLVLLPDTRAQPLLANVAAICGWLAAELIVLTVARTERAAQRSRLEVEAVLAEQDREAEVDSVVGADALESVAHVARWRRCPLVVMERQEISLWRRWLGRNNADDALKRAHGFSLLLLPAKVNLKNTIVVPAIDIKAPSLSVHDVFPNE